MLDLAQQFEEICLVWGMRINSLPKMHTEPVNYRRNRADEYNRDRRISSFAIWWLQLLKICVVSFLVTLIPSLNMLLTFTMIIAALIHFGKGEGIMGASHAIELGIVFFSLIFIGPGKYSVDKK